MPRSLFGRGSRGAIIRRIQQRLSRGGYYTGNLDGLYGGGTERAVAAYQRDRALPATGMVDEYTWKALMRVRIPSVQERCLQLTAAFEGHGFGMVQGNWDGAWLTWGIIGFTLKHGEIGRIVLEVHAKQPGVMRQAFGGLTNELLTVLRAPAADQEAWANRISLGPRRYTVAEPWRAAFDRFGQQDVAQRAQLRRVGAGYFTPAMATARQFQLRTERGMALCFDAQVQNGGIGPEARAAIEAAVADRPPEDERTLCLLIANAIADHARPAYREDVRCRKGAIVAGAGMVHGEHFTIDRWGLDESAWEAAPRR